MGGFQEEGACTAVITPVDLHGLRRRLAYTLKSTRRVSRCGMDSWSGGLDRWFAVAWSCWRDDVSPWNLEEINAILYPVFVLVSIEIGPCRCSKLGNSGGAEIPSIQWPNTRRREGLKKEQWECFLDGCEAAVRSYEATPALTLPTLSTWHGLKAAAAGGLLPRNTSSLSSIARQPPRLHPPSFPPDNSYCGLPSLPPRSLLPREKKV